MMRVASILRRRSPPWLAIAIVLGLVSAVDPAAAAARSATDLLAEANGPLGYALVFLFAATPWLEILLVIPIGVGIGMNALGVAVFAFLGNVLPIYAIIAFHDRVRAWWEKRRGKESGSRGRGRARAIWDRYGLPGLALASPIVTGVHLAALIALALGSRKRSVGAWMTASIALWTAILTVGSYYGFGFVTGL